jgi:Luciferase-like monooxygenase
MVPVAIAAVGEAMLRVAGEVCDGVRLHPLCSRRYVEEIALPRIEEGMRRSGRSRANFDLFGGGFVITGPDTKTVADSMEWARRRIAFYGSTRTYASILALHGLEDLGRKLHAMSVSGRWAEMPAEVSDEVVRIFAACGTYREIVPEIEARYAGLADAIELTFSADTPGLATRAANRDPTYSAALPRLRYALVTGSGCLRVLYPQNLDARCGGQYLTEGVHPVSCLLRRSNAAVAELVELVEARQLDLELQRSPLPRSAGERYEHPGIETIGASRVRLTADEVDRALAIDWQHIV